jgi:hypothetical protein
MWQPLRAVYDETGNVTAILSLSVRGKAGAEKFTPKTKKSGNFLQMK